MFQHQFMAYGPLSLVSTSTQDSVVCAGMRDDWASSHAPGDDILSLETGDIVIIYATNLMDISKSNYEYVSAERAMQEELQNQMLDDSDEFEQDYQEEFKADTVGFLLSVGFPARLESNIPISLIEEPLSPVTEKNKDFHFTQQFAQMQTLLANSKSFSSELNTQLDQDPNTLLASFGFSGRQIADILPHDEIIYCGIMELEEEQYTTEFKFTNGVTHELKFQGMQKGLNPALWASLFLKSHHALVIRPNFGVA